MMRGLAAAAFWIRSMPFSAVRSPSMVLLACSAAVALLTACAPLSPNTAQVGRTQVSLDSNPDLQWKYWGTDSKS